ncbi:MAG: relaxase domain-containing protein [Actinobacteria bacterium]|nr:relaxase domain-containing protein [Actinomycetota bacterium]
MSLSRMSAGSGFEYLMRHTARGDAPERSTAMTRYYVAAGYPAGVWLGAGLAGVNDGAGLVVGSVVTEEQMAHLFGAGHDPATGTPLGREYPASARPADRIAAQVAQLPADLPPAVREAKIAAVTAAEKARDSRGAVAGFDLTFSVPKSVSVLWALSDADVQRAIVAAHHEAVALTIRLIERDVARTRTGRGGSARVPVRGLIAAGFDHHDSRAGDPQLHTHVTIANRVQAASDGQWRTLDSRSLYAASVAHSDTYDLLLADNLTRALGLAWEVRLRGRARNPRRELAAIPDHLITEFSQRTAAITAAKDAAIDTFVAKHHRQPTGPEAVRIRQQATLETRQPKHISTLAEYTAVWTRRADLILGSDARAWARAVTATPGTAIPTVATGPAAAWGPDTTRDSTRLVTADAIDEQTIEVLAAAALDKVEAKRATWSRWNLVAATCRAIGGAGLQFVTEQDLLEVRRRVTTAAIERSVLLNPANTPTAVTEVDATTGRSIYDAPEVFTSLEVMAAEDALLQAAETSTAPTVSTDIVEAVVTAPLPGRDHGLAPDQAAAVRAICNSGRVCDVLVGPAGTGKTTTMAGLRAAWEREHGPGSVLGLATSAVAAEVLATEIQVAAENTAQWLAQQQFQPGRAQRVAQLEARRADAVAESRPTDRLDAAIAHAQAHFDRWALHPGQLLVVDEAGMADLPTLNALAQQTNQAGAKLLLVGDHAQLPAIGAGGTFQLLAEHQSDTPQLTDIRRFTAPDGQPRRWEAEVSLKLRRGDPAALDAYQAHGRFTDGDADAMIHAAHQAWKADKARGLTSLLIAADNDTVQALNLTVRADLIEIGHVHAEGVPLHDGTVAGIGDRIITRRVDRRLPDGTSPNSRTDERGRLAEGFVKNGTVLTITDVRRDGAIRVHVSGGQPVILPADYVAEHVELGYAVTAHRCQGVTVDTTHTIASGRMTREAFYVAMTRGRLSNHTYIDTDTCHGNLDNLNRERETRPARAVLEQILTNQGAEPSAHALQSRLATRGTTRQGQGRYWRHAIRSSEQAGIFR